MLLYSRYRKYIAHLETESTEFEVKDPATCYGASAVDQDLCPHSIKQADTQCVTAESFRKRDAHVSPPRRAPAVGKVRKSFGKSKYSRTT